VEFQSTDYESHSSISAPQFHVAAWFSRLGAKSKNCSKAGMPRRKCSLADDLVLAPWWVSAVLALLAYGILPSMLPTTLVKSGLVGVVTVGLLGLGAISALRSLKNKGILDAQTGIDSLREMHWKTFEEILAEAYRRQGYKVEEMLGGGADGGVDLRLGRDGQVILVQCKRWRNRPVPVEIVREMFGVMMHERATGAKIAATTSFTPDAIAFAKGKPIELVDSDALLRLVRDVQTKPRITSVAEQRDYLTPACPKCRATMVLRKARRGANARSKFWGCPTYPQCRGTRPL
jgi:restriction system protein